MRVLKIMISMFWLACSCPGLVRGQESAKQQAVAILQSAAERYHNAGRLHFVIQYRYATAEKPRVYLDSLKGDLKLNGDKYRYVMDSTEFVGSKDLTAILFRQDQVIYLVRPSATPQNANPLALLDSLLLKSDSVDCQMKQADGMKTIAISFRSGMATKQVEYTIDDHTGFVTKMTSLVPARELYAPISQSRVEDNGTNVIVEADFIQGKKNDFTDAELDPGQYFKKEGKKYTPLSPYGSYRIVLGTPDL